MGGRREGIQWCTPLTFCPIMTSTVAAVSQTQSLAAIRNFVRVSVSSIAYARGLCSENSFEQRPFLGLPLQHMVPSSPESLAISEWIENGAFDALNRGFLREMALCVYTADCAELLESYCFGFCYSPDGQRAQMTWRVSDESQGSGAESAVSKGNGSGCYGAPTCRKQRCSKQEVQQMLTQILVKLMDIIEHLPPLLSARLLTMRLLYYDEVTPSSYEPPCFAAASERMVDLYQKELQYSISIGVMDTTHHLFNVSVRHPLLKQLQSRWNERTQSSTCSTLPTQLEATFSSDIPEVQNERAEATTGSTVVISEAVRRIGSVPGIHSPVHRAGTSNRCTAVVDTEAQQHIPSIVALVENSYARDLPLRQRDTAILLICAYCFSKAPGAVGGCGRVSLQDVEAYLVKACPLDVSTAVAMGVIEKLVDDGFLCCDTSAAQSHYAHLQNSEAPAKSSVWFVKDPPLPLLDKLMRIGAVTDLLSHAEATALRHLSAALTSEKHCHHVVEKKTRRICGQKRKRESQRC